MKLHTIGASAAAAAFALILNTAATAVTTFEAFPLPAEGYWNGSDGSGGFTLDGATFNNSFTDWGGGFTSWAGFAVSNHTDTTTSGFGNQYSAYAGSGAGASSQYAVGYSSSTSTITFAEIVDLTGLGASFTNTTYAALDILNGSGFSKSFGGATGDDADWFLLTIEGFADSSSTGTVDFYLADYRFADNGQDYIVDDWTHVDFSSLGSVDELRFSLTSSDNGSFGMNTPGYFAMDNFLAVPEPSSLLVALSGLALIARRKR